MPVNSLKQPTASQKALILGLTIFLILLFQQLSASRLFNAQPLNTDGLQALEQVQIKKSSQWLPVELPHHDQLADTKSPESSLYRVALPSGTPATGFALLIPSYRYHLEFRLNGQTLLTAGNRLTLWLRPSLTPVVIPLDLRDQGVPNSILELEISGPIKGRGLDTLWIGAYEDIQKAHNPVTESLPAILNTTLATLLLAIIFLSIDRRSFWASRLHLLLLTPQVVLTFLLIPPDTLSSSLLAYKVFQTSFLTTILAWGAFGYKSAGIRLHTLKWPILLVTVALAPLWLASDSVSARALAANLIAPTAGILGVYLAGHCTIKRCRFEMVHSNRSTLVLGSMLLGAGLSDLFTLNQYHGFAQAVVYPYAASFVVIALFARLALQMSERTHELRIHQRSMSQLVRARTEELEQAQSKLIRHERFQTLNAMGAAISHEVKSPLGTLSSDLHMLNKLDSTRSEQEKTILQRMNRSVSRIDRTLSDLSSYVKRDQVNTETLDFSQWLQQLLSDEEVNSMTKGAIVHQEIQPGLKLRFDADMLRRALINIIKNAINACSHRYSPQLFVAATRDENTIVIHIEDNGTGLAPELGENIFEPLVSGSKSGLGLGLSVVRDIMQLHNGRLEIGNRGDGKGAKVCLYLPIDEELLSESTLHEVNERTAD